MQKGIKTHLFTISIAMLILPLFASMGCKKHSTCHKSIKVVNNSADTIFIGRPIYFGKEFVQLLDCCDPILPNDTAVVQVIIRHCLEDYDDCSNRFYVLPESSSGVQTTHDSLYIIYGILKTIELQELGVDSLVNTDYIVYYP